jgi:peptide chain release factor 3
MITQDNDLNYVILFENEWGIEWAKDKNKGLVLNDVKQ